MSRILSRSLRALLTFGPLVLPFSIVGIAAGQVPDPKKNSAQDLKFFESRIRPILVDKCYSCHSLDANSAEGGLRLDSADAILRGGSGGPAIVAGDPQSSLLIKAIEYNDPDFAMPPQDSGGKLSENEIRDLTRWVKIGAPDPRKDPEHLESHKAVTAGKEWWAFQPIASPDIPNTSSDWAWNNIDRFVEAKQKEIGLTPNEDASPEALLRRLYFDAIGLPPTPEQQKAFLDKIKAGGSRQSVIENEVDQLLESDQFGVHWGRHWLDVARYAESSGRDVNLPYNNAWRYRDWVIHAVNQNMPYDQFLISQIAGDQLETSSPVKKGENLIATGFLAVGSKNINEPNPKQFAVDQADEQIDTVFQSTMALTVACSRCHDHKFDPISQREYTAIAGIFLSTQTHTGVGGGPQARNGSKPLDLPKGNDQPIVREAVLPSEIAKRKEELASLKREIEDAVRSRMRDRMREKEIENPADQQKLRRAGIEIAQLEFGLNEFLDDGTPKAQAMAVTDKGQFASLQSDRPRLARFMAGRGGTDGFNKIDDSPFFARGDIDLPGAKVKRGVIELFGDSTKIIIPPGKSGRMELAQWIVGNSNPMTARVAVNRFWYWTIGQGIVTSLDNFGTTGSKPSNPELLDYLASEFQSNHWDMKRTIREILTSRTYQISSISTPRVAGNSERDPENAFCWKAKSRRLQAEEIRDAMLMSAGVIDLSPHPGTSLSKLGQQRLDRVAPRRRGRGEVSTDELVRSIYLPLPRSAAPEILELFDLPDAASVQSVREATNVPTQSLFMLNNPMISTAAGKLVRTVAALHPGRPNEKFNERLTAIYQFLLCRKPTPEEERLAKKMILQSDAPEQGWISVVRGLYATAEFRYLD